MFKVATIVALAVTAEPRPGQCSSILKKDKAGIFLVPAGTEGICNINKSQEKKVSPKCRLGA
jgi:hypothetical protein